jgi:hypothetical protein
MAHPEMKINGGQEHAINVTASESVVAQELQDLRDMVKTTLSKLQSSVEKHCPAGRTLDDSGSPV